MPFYAVAEGKKPGIYREWGTAKAQVDGWSKAKFKKFPNLEGANAFMKQHSNSHSTQSSSSPRKRSRADDAHVNVNVNDHARSGGEDAKRSKTAAATITTTTTTTTTATGPYYALATGQKPGIYQKWKQVENLIKGQFSAEYRRFETKEDAQRFLTEHRSKRKVNLANGDPDPQSPSSLVAFTDGSALDNGYDRCRAGYACVFPHNETWNVAEKLLGPPKPTNNRAEYMAALKAMERANMEDPDKKHVLFIFSDSMLLIRSMTQWLPGWQANNWRKKDYSPVMNADILKKLHFQQGSRRIIWQHVKAHTNKKGWKFRWNDKADQMAKEAASSEASARTHTTSRSSISSSSSVDEIETKQHTSKSTSFASSAIAQAWSRSRPRSHQHTKDNQTSIYKLGSDAKTCIAIDIDDDDHDDPPNNTLFASSTVSQSRPYQGQGQDKKNNQTPKSKLGSDANTCITIDIDV